MLLSNGAKKYFPLFFSVYYIARENINIFTGYVVGRENINIFTGSVIEYLSKAPKKMMSEPGIEPGAAAWQASVLPTTLRVFALRISSSFPFLYLM